MSAESVITRIEQMAAEEIEEILLTGKQKIKAAEEAIINDAEEKSAEILLQASDSAKSLIRAAEQQGELDGRINVLNAKHRLLDELRSAAKEQMLAFDDKRWYELYARLIMEYAMPGETLVKIPQADKRKYTEESFCTDTLGRTGLLLDILGKKASERSDIAMTLRLHPEFADIDGGVILCGEYYDIDLSYDAILGEIFDMNEKKIADCLFGDGAGTS